MMHNPTTPQGVWRDRIFITLGVAVVSVPWWLGIVCIFNFFTT